MRAIHRGPNVAPQWQAGDVNFGGVAETSAALTGPAQSVPGRRVSSALGSPV